MMLGSKVEPNSCELFDSLSFYSYVTLGRDSCVHRARSVHEQRRNMQYVVTVDNRSDI